MICLQETTSDLRPHTYLVDEDKGKMLAYRKDSGEIDVFSKPMTFSKRYRKFKKVVDNELVQSYTVYNS
jgi:hypothetical protein